MRYWLCLFLVVTLQWLAACSPAGMQAQAQRSSKIAPELIALHEEYASHLASGSREPFRSSNRLLHIVDGYVVIDGVASKDAIVLQKDLVALGMRQPVSFGRIVSGQLPISSIPQLATLSSLNFARAASGITQKVEPPTLPGRR